MLNVTLWGTRGSIPVSGPQFRRHGGATTCIEIEVASDCASTPSRVIIDGGSGLAALGRRSQQGWGDAVLFQTHFHWDHIQGFPLFGPLFNPATQLRLHATPRDGRTLQEVLSTQMERPLFPVALADVPATLEFENIDDLGQCCLGELQVQWAEMCHPSGSTAYRITHGDTTMVFSGDVEVRRGGRPELIELATGADVLVMDAQYFEHEYPDRRGFGHSTTNDALEVALEAGVDRLFLTHHDPTHSDDDLDEAVARVRQKVDGQVQIANACDGLQIAFGDAEAASKTEPAAQAT